MDRSSDCFVGLRSLPSGSFGGFMALAFILSAVAATPRSMAAPSNEAFDEDLNAYRKTEATGLVAQLNQRLALRQATLSLDDQHGYLPSLLRELQIPPSSQMLVASKTSPNRHFISPKNPRALYYNDQAAVAYVPGAPLLEVAASDPKLGAVFYTLDQKLSAQPRLVRDDRCLECHASVKTLNIPGFLVRSFRTEDDGEVDLLSGKVVTHRTPLAERWGGYYVTGTHGDQTHLGNLFGPDAHTRHEKDPRVNGNITNLATFLQTRNFLGAGSDIVALLVFDHQEQMENLLTRLSYETIAAQHRGDDLRPTYPAAEAVLKYLLFTDEAILTAPVQGTSTFAQWFESNGPKDGAGRSLRQLDLQTRLFKFPCSYLIYSPSFQGLPAGAKLHLWRRLAQILAGEDKSPDFQKIPPQTKQAIQQILTETHPDLPAFWRL
ncbi:MAG: hypothetical protein U1G07_12460 [Verrucomicrobiota bacterium]